MQVVIDKKSGFCFGVVYAIQMAEDILAVEDSLYCLGDIVHNDKEVDRLNEMGLQIIDHKKFKTLKDCKVLIRAHGEPPATYQLALKNNIQLLDASCPVVLKLQHQIKEGHEDIQNIDGQIVIYGKDGHAEVIGLVGQTRGEAIIVYSDEDLNKINFKRPIYLYSQTTKSPQAFADIVAKIKLRIVDAGGKEEIKFIVHDTLCSQVSRKEPHLKTFSKENDVVIFVSGTKSSNGKMLYSTCKKENPNTYFISDTDEIKKDWFNNVSSVGVCGATSTPRWLMEKVALQIENY